MNHHRHRHRHRHLLAGLAAAASAVGVLSTTVPATALTSGSVTSGTSPVAAVAAAVAPGSTVTVTASGTRLEYTGLGTSANTVTVSGFGPTTFLLTDTLPIQAGPGCAPQTVPAGLFGVTCTAPVNSEGEFSQFTVKLGAGRDSVTNLAPAKMSAFGGDGDDTMIGGPLDDNFSDVAGADTIRGRSGNDDINLNFSGADLLPDVLDGGRGDDDLFAGPSADKLIGGTGDDQMQGGLGADLLDGGSGRDHASYTDSGHSSVKVAVTLDDKANDGQLPLTGISEGDNVTSTVEDITGNSGPDLLFGNSAANRLVGLGGDDFLEGNRGKDDLQGGSGVDKLFGNEFLGALIDGTVDTVDGGEDAPDRCSASLVDGDLTPGCEIVDNT